MGFPSGSEVKNLSASAETQETRVRSWGREDPLEKEMATHCSIVSWEILWTEKPGGLQAMGLQNLDMTQGLSNNKYLKTNL